MVETRKINWLKLILAFLIASLLLFLGLFLGFLAKGVVSQASIDIEESVKNDITNLETLFILEDSYPCSPKILDITSERLDYLGELITILETKKGQKTKEVLELKKLYTILETRHFILVEKRNDICDQNNDIFYYFYSNEDQCTGEVEKSSFVLTYLRNKYETVKVYSFDLNLDSDIVEVLKEKYEIDSCSGVVLNGEKIPFKIENSDKLEETLLSTK